MEVQLIPFPTGATRATGIGLASLSLDRDLPEFPTAVGHDGQGCDVWEAGQGMVQKNRVWRTEEVRWRQSDMM